jgi:hypothetical protein
MIEQEALAALKDLNRGRFDADAVPTWDPGRASGRGTSNRTPVATALYGESPECRVSREPLPSAGRRDALRDLATALAVASREQP